MDTSQEPALAHDGVAAAQIDTFPIDGPLDMIQFETTGLKAVSPVTNAPDSYDAIIVFTPHELLIESESLVGYLETFKDQSLFAEHLAPRIASQLAEAIKVPVRVELRQHERGGVTTTVSATIGPAGNAAADHDHSGHDH